VTGLVVAVGGSSPFGRGPAAEVGGAPTARLTIWSGWRVPTPTSRTDRRGSRTVGNVATPASASRRSGPPELRPSRPKYDERDGYCSRRSALRGHDRLGLESQRLRTRCSVGQDELPLDLMPSTAAPWSPSKRCQPNVQSKGRVTSAQSQGSTSQRATANKATEAALADIGGESSTVS